MTVKSILSKTFPGGLGQWMHGNKLDAALGAFDQDKVKASLESRNYILLLTVIIMQEDDMFSEAATDLKQLLDDKHIEHAFLDIRPGVFPFSKIFVIAIQPDAPPNRHVNEALRNTDSSFEYFRMAEKGMHLLNNITPEHHAIARTQAFYGMLSANGLTTIDDILNPP